MFMLNYLRYTIDRDRPQDEILEPTAHTRDLSRARTSALVLPWPLVSTHTCRVKMDNDPMRPWRSRLGNATRYPVSEAKGGAPQKRREVSIRKPGHSTFKLRKCSFGSFCAEGRGVGRWGGEKTESEREMKIEMGYGRDGISRTPLRCTLEDLVAARTRGEVVGIDGRAVVGGFECESGGRGGECRGEGWRRT